MFHEYLGRWLRFGLQRRNLARGGFSSGIRIPVEPGKAIPRPGLTRGSARLVACGNEEKSKGTGALLVGTGMR